MKSRKVYLRNACFTVNGLQSGCLYQVMKRGTNLLQPHDYWYGALVWKRDQDENVEGIGLLKGSSIGGVVGHTFFPVIKFDETFKFTEIPVKPVSAIRCRHKQVAYTKKF